MLQLYGTGALRASGIISISRISGETITAKISGETIIAKISGETITAKISGETVKSSIPSDLLHGMVTLSGDSAISIGSAECVAVIIKAHPTNSGLVYIGNSTLSGSDGFVLAPGETLSLTIRNVNKIYALREVDGDKICWIALTE